MRCEGGHGPDREDVWRGGGRGGGGPGRKVYGEGHSSRALLTPPIGPVDDTGNPRPPLPLRAGSAPGDPQPPPPFPD